MYITTLKLKTQPSPLNSLPSYHRTAYPDLILVFPLLLALSNDTCMVLDTGHYKFIIIIIITSYSKHALFSN